MKPRQIELLLALAAVMTITITTATPIPLKDSIPSRSESDEANVGKQIIRSEKRIWTCLRIAPNLPPCNFDSEATWRSRSGEIFLADPAAGSGYPVGVLPDFLDNGSAEKIITAETTGRKDFGTQKSNTGDKNLEEFHFYENDLAFTVVYYLEGCLPARLPFDLPSCPIDELQTIQMNKLVPFQLPDVEDALIFPEIDVKQIEFSHRQSRAPLPAASQSHEDGEENEDSSIDGSGKEEKILDRSSSFLTGNENGLTFEVGDFKALEKGVQDFHKTILKSSMTPRIGTASTKYVSKLPAASSGLTTAMVDSGLLHSSTLLKNKEKPASFISGENEEPDEVGESLVKDKDRVQ